MIIYILPIFYVLLGVSMEFFESVEDSEQLNAFCFSSSCPVYITFTNMFSLVNAGKELFLRFVFIYI